jgi:hypothetical protein
MVGLITISTHMTFPYRRLSLGAVSFLFVSILYPSIQGCLVELLSRGMCFKFLSGQTWKSMIKIVWISRWIDLGSVPLSQKNNNMRMLKDKVIAG